MKIEYGSHPYHLQNVSCYPIKKRIRMMYPKAPTVYQFSPVREYPARPVR